MVWVLAHNSHTTIGEAKNGDGTRPTTIDWRLNSLVDVLAKIAATHLQAPRDIAAFVRSADAAAAHAACLLDVVTHAAYNFIQRSSVRQAVWFQSHSETPPTD